MFKRLITFLDGDQREEFARLAANKFGDLTWLVSGEWSQTPWHQGDVEFGFRRCEEHGVWALLQLSDSVDEWNRVVVVAEPLPGHTTEQIVAGMMRELRLQHGPYVDLVDRCNEDDVDFDAIWDEYWA